MKKVSSLVAVVGLLFVSLFLFSSCTQQCDCQKVTHYATHSTTQNYYETISVDESCSKFNGEFFKEDIYGNTISVDVVTCKSHVY